jgi:hypothetical protein
MACAAQDHRHALPAGAVLQVDALHLHVLQTQGRIGARANSG